MRRLARSTMGVVIVVLVLAGCAGTKSAAITAPTVTAPPNMTVGKVCQPIQSVSQTLTQLSGMGANTTVGAVRTAQQKLAVAVGLIGGLPAAHGAAYDSLKSTNEQLAAAMAMVKDVPDTTTVGQVGPNLQAVKQQVAAAEAATTQLASAFSCKG